MKWRHLTHHLRDAILDFTIFRNKVHEIKEINTKPRQNDYEMCKFINVCYFIRKTGKTTELSQQMIFGQTCVEFDGWHGNVKIDRATIYMSKCLQRMNEQLLKFWSP